MCRRLSCEQQTKVSVWVPITNTHRIFREDSFIDFVQRNVSGTFRGVGVLLLDVSVKMKFIDFLQSRIKQTCAKISQLHLKNE